MVAANPGTTALIRRVDTASWNGMYVGKLHTGDVESSSEHHRNAVYCPPCTINTHSHFRLLGSTE